MNVRHEIESHTWRLASALPIACVLALALGAASAEARGCRRDADCDGLNNKEERTYGTSRSNADTDHDGLSDAVEIRRLSSNPLDDDSDDDGIEDGDELADGTDPGSSDSDGDGSHDGEDSDPHDDLKAKLVGPVDGVDAGGQTITMFGCLTIDASTASLDGFALADLTTDTVAKITLDPIALPALKAVRIEREDDDHDGVPDDHEDDDGPGSGDDGGSDGSGGDGHSDDD